MPNPRLIITLPQALKRVVEQAATHRGCSQAEVIKSALYDHLSDFLANDNKTQSHSSDNASTNETKTRGRRTK